MTIHSTDIILPASQYGRVGYHPLQVATKVMVDLTRYYFPLHDLSPHDALPHYPALLFIEGLICQGEEEMERIAQAGGHDVFAVWRQSKAYVQDFWAEHQLSHPRLDRYLADIETFFQVIYRLLYRHELTRAHIVQAMEFAPADFRLSHATACLLTQRPLDDTLFELLEPLEVLRDIHWHLSNFSDDEQHNYFNIYQMFMKLYGEDAPNQLKIEQYRLEQVLAERWAGAAEKDKKILQPILTAYQQGMTALNFPPRGL